MEKSPSSDFDCSICLEFLDLESNVNIARTSCDHTFHLSCLSNWLKNHQTCPICRESVYIMNRQSENVEDNRRLVVLNCNQTLPLLFLLTIILLLFLL